MWCHENYAKVSCTQVYLRGSMFRLIRLLVAEQQERVASSALPTGHWTHSDTHICTYLWSTRHHHHCELITSLVQPEHWWWWCWSGHCCGCGWCCEAAVVVLWAEADWAAQHCTVQLRPGRRTLHHTPQHTTHLTQICIISTEYSVSAWYYHGVRIGKFQPPPVLVRKL